MSRALALLRGSVNDLMQRPKGNLPVLDVLRSLAILGVFTAHSIGLAGLTNATATITRLPVFRYGWTGVDLFFVLSGFLIGQQLWKELKRTGHIRIGRFLLRRGLRIWPLYYGFVFFILGEVAFLGRSPKRLLLDALFVTNYFPDSQVSGGWSLSTEEQFYLVAPVVIAFMVWLGVKAGRLWTIPAVMVSISVASRAFSVSASSLDVHDLRLSLFYPFHTHLDGLATGLLLAWLSIFRADLLQARWKLGLLMVSMAALGAAFYLLDPVVFSFTALSLFFGAATLYGIGPLPRPGLLNWHGFYILSRLSYGMYLNHFGVLHVIRILFGKQCLRHGTPGFIAYYVVCLIASIALAAVTFTCIEWPFLELRARYLQKPAPALQPVA